jgi:hypothetical protein
MTTERRAIVSATRRALAFIPIAITAVAVVSGGDWWTAASVARAQIGGVPAAPPAPIAPPPAPPGLRQGALPRLLPGPSSTSILQATPGATPRVFRCSCSGPGAGAQWVGTVVAQGYLLANQTAAGACTAFKLNATAASPLIPTPGFGFRAPQAPQTGSAAGLNTGSVRQPGAITPNQLQTEQAIVASACSNCACN